MSSAAFVLMNLDLVAVPLQLDPTRVVTVYCGKRRADELLTAPTPHQEPGRSLGASSQLLLASRRSALHAALPVDRR